jgi:hypothetical protein
MELVDVRQSSLVSTACRRRTTLTTLNACITSVLVSLQLPSAHPSAVRHAGAGAAVLLLGTGCLLSWPGWCAGSQAQTSAAFHSCTRPLQEQTRQHPALSTGTIPPSANNDVCTTADGPAAKHRAMLLSHIVEEAGDGWSPR